MKLKKKLFTSLATIGMITAAATVVAACAKDNNTPEEEEEGDDWNINIDFTGTSKTVLTSSNSYSSIKVSNFQLSSPLGVDEKMTVFSTTPGVSVVSWPTQPQQTFDIYVKLNEQPAEEHVTIPFDLKFKFSVNDIEKATKVIDGFVIDYWKEETWEDNNISWKVREDGSTPYNMNFTTAEGQTTYEVRDFVLDHELQPFEDIQLGQTTISEQGVKMTADIVRPIQGKSVTVKYTITDLGDAGYDTPIRFKQAFKFVFKQEEKETITLPTGGQFFTLTARKQYEPPKVNINGFEDQTTIEWDTGGEEAIKTPGISGFYYDSYAHYTPGQLHTSKCFVLDRPLSGDDEIKLFCNNEHIDASLVLTPNTSVESGNDVGGQFIDIKVAFNNLYDPFVEKTETFRLAFEYYFAGQPRGFQWLTQDFVLHYTPLPNPTPNPDDYGITLDPIAIDTTGYGELTFQGKISKEGSTTGFDGLDDDDYLVVENESFGDYIMSEYQGSPWPVYNGYYFTSPATDMSEENAPILYDWSDRAATKEEAIERGWVRMPKPAVAIKGSDIEDPNHVIVNFTMKYCTEPQYGQGAWEQIFNYSSQPFVWTSNIKATFYDTDPFEEPQEDPEWDPIEINAPMDIMYYPVNMWNGDAVSSTETWMKQRSLVLGMAILEDPVEGEHQEEPTDKSLWTYKYTNAIFTGQELSWSTEYFITPWDFAQSLIDWTKVNIDEYSGLVLDTNFAKRFPKIGIGIANSAHRYLPNDQSEYLLPENDMLWINLINDYGPDYSDEYRFYLPLYYAGGPLDIPDLDSFTWTSKNPNANLYGPDLAIFGFKRDLLPGRESFTPGSREYDIVCDFESYITILERWYHEEEVDHEDCYTNFMLNDRNVNMDNWAYAFCGGFDSKEIEIDGKNKQVFYWKNNVINMSDFDAKPITKSLDDAKNQNFPDLGVFGENNIKHASYAYQLNKSYQVDNDEWFNDTNFSKSTMFVVRQWKDGKFGEELDLPRLAGVNIGHGIVDPNDTNKFFPWFDLFSNDSANLLEDYLVWE